MSIKVGIIGHGFVGRAVHVGFSRGVNGYFYIYDPYVEVNSYLTFTEEFNLKKNSCVVETEYELGECDLIFVCIPTPTNFETGNQDLSSFYKIFDRLAEVNNSSLIVIKSTVRPGSTADFIKVYPTLNFVFNPEFLTEENYLDDFIHQDRIVIGGSLVNCLALQSLYKTGWPHASYFLMNSTEAETVKYAANAFLSTKIAFFNEIYNLCEKEGCSYEKIKDAVVSDKRIGEWGSKVPGPDGQFGFGKKCFPKDIVTLISLLNDLNCPSNVIEGAWRTNEEVRASEDWKEIRGASTENLHG